MKTNAIDKLRAIEVMLNTSQQLCVMPDYLTVIKEKLKHFLDDYSEPDSGADMPDMPMNNQPDITGDAITVINASGLLVKAGDLDEDIEAMCGICNIDRVTEELKEASEDENANLICMVFDSCGGDACGIRELAELISTVSDNKLLIGYCDTIAASGCYWLASQCGIFVCSKSSTIGNVGCYTERVDMTEQLKEDGVKVNIISDGAMKIWGHPATIMSKEEEAYIQETVSTIATQFRQAILSHRQVDVQYLQGQVFLGEKAADPTINLADLNVSDLDSLITFFVQTTYIGGNEYLAKIV